MPVLISSYQHELAAPVALNSVWWPDKSWVQGWRGREGSMQCIPGLGKEVAGGKIIHIETYSRKHNKCGELGWWVGYLFACSCFLSALFPFFLHLFHSHSFPLPDLDKVTDSMTLTASLSPCPFIFLEKLHFPQSQKLSGPVIRFLDSGYFPVSGNGRIVLRIDLKLSVYEGGWKKKKEREEKATPLSPLFLMNRTAGICHDEAF